MQTWKLDEWDAAGDITFIFGADARKPMIARAQGLPRVGLATPPTSGPVRGQNQAAGQTS